MHGAAFSVCVGLVLLAVTAPALEVDCAACNFCAGKDDQADAIDARLRQHLLAGKTVQQIAEAEGGGSVVRPRIEVWADHLPEAVQPDRRRFKYRGGGLPDSAALSAFAPSIRVNGVCMGTDKLAHLFQEGWEYYRISVLERKGDALALRFGEWQEGLLPRECYISDETYFLKQPMGRYGYGMYGRCISGVISHADLAANKAGLKLYKDLATGRFKTIRDYVTKDFCEEANPNDYTPAMKQVVERNSRTNSAATALVSKPCL